MSRRYIIIIGSILVNMTIGVLLTFNSDVLIIHSSDIWGKYILTAYLILSVIFFATINLFAIVNSKLLNNATSFWKPNLNALYGFIIGTSVYLFSNIYTFNSPLRFYTLIVPLLAITIGFNYPLKGIENLKEIKRLVLIIVNVVILLYSFFYSLDMHRYMEVLEKDIKTTLTYESDLINASIDRTDSLKQRLNTFESSNSLSKLLVDQKFLYYNLRQLKRVNKIQNEALQNNKYFREELNIFLLTMVIITVFFNLVTPRIS